MRIPKISLSQIQDLFVRDGFQQLLNYLRAESPLQDFRLVTATFTAPGKQTFRHGMTYAPQDILLTQKLGAGAIAWNYTEFTSELLSITLSGDVSPTNPTKIRLLAGTLNQGAS